MIRISARRLPSALPLRRMTLSALLLLLVVACGQREEQPDLLVAEDAHMMTLPPGQTVGAVYLALSNSSEQDLVLNHIDAPVAGVAEVHRHLYEDGVMRMRQVHHLTVPAKSTLVFEPGGYHIMLMEVADVPPSGDSFAMRLEFSHGEALTVDVEVRPVH